MKRKINLEFAIMTMVAILFTVGLSVVISYDMFRREVQESLRICAQELKSAKVFENPEGFEPEPVEHLRVTLVDTDGTVICDTNASIGVMENHSGRPEVQEAFQSGEGEDMRRSSTLQKNTFYYAVRLENGRVLRVAKEAGNLLSFLRTMALPLMVMAAVLIFICVCLAHFLTRSILAPIEQMASHMDDVDEGNAETPYRELEPFIQTIRDQHKDIVKSSRMRQEFTANVSHELKTPLTAISGYAELIASGMTKPEDTQRFAEEISKSSSRLLALINDILRLSELDASGEVPMEELDLFELAEKCVEMLQVHADKQNVTLMLTGGSCPMRGNREMVDELIYNLCSNAIRYNVPYGNVVVSVAREGEACILTVKDTGIGIPQGEQERIFERFYRVDKSRSKSTGGTGLGLAIVKHVVQCHGASLKLQSQVGVGTSVSVTFGGSGPADHF